MKKIEKPFFKNFLNMAGLNSWHIQGYKNQLFLINILYRSNFLGIIQMPAIQGL
ncbi:hypothetical protein [Parafilimonas terrae]|jgi:hypothetical protein|uniref:Uncharacterized protein n=1 Tax=Parafilimonas terrae TaxID=1465490 RepID=A0A1I5WYN3_9BACT|nr:hypothetical protein [Parafilimonas terrae]SFQ24617.1 hypothetical protein SAMN05444277_10779 [Parafilimonas terrae]